VRLEAIARQWESLKSCGRGIAVSQNVVQTFLFAALGMPRLLPASHGRELWRLWDRKLPNHPFV
jgi:hypothetical protein